MTRKNFLNDEDAPTPTLNTMPPASNVPVAAGAQNWRKKTRRNREWEKTNRAYTIKGIPHEILEKVGNVARELDELMVIRPSDTAASELLRIAMEDCETGLCAITVRNTYQNSAILTRGSGSVSGRTHSPAKKSKLGRAVYRLPDEQFTALKVLRDRIVAAYSPRVVELTLGELTTQLLAHSLKKIETGDIQWEIAPGGWSSQRANATRRQA